MEFKVIWTKQALENLTEIKDFLRVDSEERAGIVVRKIENLADSLDKFPYRGHRPREKILIDKYELNVYHYRIIYEIAENIILIRFIAHSAQQKFKNQPG